MSDYRVVEITNGYGSTYKVEKKSWLGFWYNPLNIDAYTTGYYDSLEEAKRVIREITTNTTKKVVYTR